ncbi:universal stress protein [Halovivax sp.]|uniref:universal stress protein n=1 Tax=Halovivax sp. TaxID=1935978 RepID=UPI0025BF906C|nr:universal stress protein [Halovivax sp.]
MDEHAAVTVETVLAPVDGSEASARAAEYAITVADRYDARVHALFVLSREVVLGMDAGAVAEVDVAETAREFLADVVAHAETTDVAVSTSTAHGFSPVRKTHHPGSVVLDTADEVGADFIVIPREPSLEAAEVLEKAAEYVLGYASQPVLSV